MIEKEFHKLTMGEKFTIQKIVKKSRAGEPLTAAEQEIFDRFSAEFQQAEKVELAKRPIIIVLLISAILTLLRNLL